MAEALAVRDRGTVLRITHEGMVKYHGRLHIGGVALAFKVLEMAFPILLPGGDPAREKIGFLSGLGENGRGAIDGVEMVPRARSRGKMALDPALVKDKEAPEAPNGGHYYFEVDNGNRRVGIALKQGLISGEFIELSRKAKTDAMVPEEAARLIELREGLALLLMSKDPKDLFDVTLPACRGAASTS
jgi:hypothetical protein